MVARRWSMLWLGWHYTVWGTATGEARGAGWDSVLSGLSVAVHHARVHTNYTGNAAAGVPPDASLSPALLVARTQRLEGAAAQEKLEEGPSSAPSIAIVSLCSYPANATTLTGLSFTNKVLYARMHGYKLLLETRLVNDTMHPAWNKVSLTNHIA